MRTGFKARAEQLWYGARPWRYTVLAACFFSVLALLNTVIGPSSGSSPYAPATTSAPPPSLPPLDPAVEARLVGFDVAAADALKREGAADRCEHLAIAYDALSKDDVAIGRNVVRSTKARIDALRAAQTCQAELGASDARLSALDKVVAGLQPGAVGTWCPVVTGLYGRLTDFDRARQGRAAETLAKTGGISEACTASDRRLTALTDAVSAARTDQGAAAAERVTDALRLLTDADRTRLAATQKPVLDAADQIAGMVGRSRSRIAAIPGLLAAMGSGSEPDTVMQVLGALDGLGPFDDSLATPAQTAAIADARKKAMALVWGILKNRLAQLQGDRSAANYRAVATLYEAIQHDPDPQSADQEALLREGALATRFLAASDDRLRRMDEALAAWQAAGFAARDRVLAAVEAIQQFDRDRFDAAQTATWRNLLQASLIIRGPVLGLSKAPGTRTPIYVFSPATGLDDRRTVALFGEALRRGGYQVVAARRDASLLVSLSVRHLGTPQISTVNGFQGSFTADAEIDVDAWWASDDSRLFSSVVTGVGTTTDYKATLTEALQNAVDTAMSQIQSRAAN